MRQRRGAKRIAGPVLIRQARRSGDLERKPVNVPSPTYVRPCSWSATAPPRRRSRQAERERIIGELGQALKQQEDETAQAKQANVRAAEV